MLYIYEIEISILLAQILMNPIKNLNLFYIYSNYDINSINKVV